MWAERPLRAAMVPTRLREGDAVIRRRQRIVGLNGDFVFAPAPFRDGRKRTDAHLFQRQADVAADVFPAVERRDVQEARPIVRDGGRVAVFIQTEKVEFALCAEAEGKTLLRGAPLRRCEEAGGCPARRDGRRCR